MKAKEADSSQNWGDPEEPNSPQYDDKQSILGAREPKKTCHRMRDRRLSGYVILGLQVFIQW